MDTSARPSDQRLQALVDRQDIHDCVLRYARGVDRMDRALILSAFHPDGFNDHGVIAADSPTYVDFAMANHRERQTSHNLVIANHTCELDGDSAHTETYWFMVCRNTQAPELTVVGGRFLDRFERREGRWAIAFRRCLTEWRGVLGDPPANPELKALLDRAGIPARDATDPSYDRQPRRGD